MTPQRTSWLRVRRNRPCPVCGRPDWCLVAEDGSACICPRTPNSHPITGKRSGELVGYLHRLNREMTAAAPARSAMPRPTKARRHDLALLAAQYRSAVNPVKLARLGDTLGLCVENLHRLGIGWAHDRRAWSFPMVDAAGTVIGIRLRTEAGAKFAIAGSQNGLFMPRDRPAASPLLICEGPTSCAALLDLGYAAIGRPSCSGGGALLRNLMERLGRRDVVIFGDHDAAKQRPDGSTFYPGQEGAARLAQEILPVCRSIKVVVPPSAKDPRDWKRGGATRALMDAVIRAMNYVRPERALTA